MIGQIKDISKGGNVIFWQSLSAIIKKWKKIFTWGKRKR